MLVLWVVRLVRLVRLVHLIHLAYPFALEMFLPEGIVLVVQETQKHWQMQRCYGGLGTIRVSVCGW